MKHPFTLLALIALGALPLSGQSASAGSPEQIVNHHMSAAGSGRVDELMSDYADDAVLISPDAVLKGKQAIRGLFQTLMTPGPAALAPIDVKKRVFEGDVGYVTWIQNAGKPDEQKGSDTFVIRNGKIVYQTVMMVRTAATK